MKRTMKICRLIAVLLSIVSVLTLLAACELVRSDGGGDKKDDGGIKHTHVDYVTSLKLDMSSETKKAVLGPEELAKTLYIDGDTTHFKSSLFTKDEGFSLNTLKARYLAINTPESTGKIEEWGKKASNFTKNALSQAVSVVLESDTMTWNADSTGERYLVWVWYKTAADTEYRNLNLEILQNGLAIASNSANNRYGDICMKAINQAKTEKLHVHSDEKDPDFYYGEAQELTLRELRCNISEYNGVKVAFEGVVTANTDNGVYIEEYDSESNTYYGMYVYYGFNLSGKALQILTGIGNRVRAVGTVSEFNGSWQVSGIEYNRMEPNHPNNVQLISENNPASYAETTIAQMESKITVPVGEEGIPTEFDYANLILGTSVSLKNVTVVDVYTTQNGGDNDGAMSLTCRDSAGKTITVRTVLLYQDGKLVTEEAFRGKTIDVRGIVDTYDGDYQIKLLSMSDVIFH